MVAVLDNVERIPAPAPGVLLRDYILASRPVILTDLFDDQPIRALDTAAKLRARLPDLPVAVQPNYMTALLADGRTADPEGMTLARFMDRLAADPTTDDYCVEYPTPPAMTELIEPTEHCRLIDAADLRSLMFVAAPGNFAHLHYDDDQRHTLMYQAFGRKRYSIIDTRETGKLAPLAEPGFQRTSSVFLQHFSDADKLAFLRYANAWDCVLHPGETLLMPMMAWHYVEYLDMSLSVSYRLGRNRYNRFLAESVPIPSPFLQRVAVELLDEERVDAPRRAAFERLREAVGAAYRSPSARALALDRCCMEFVDALDPLAAQRFYTIHERHRREQLEERHELAACPAVAAPPPAGAAATTNGKGNGTPAWDDGDGVALAPGVLVAQPLGDGADVLLARDGRLELRLTIDARRPWLLQLLRLLSKHAEPATVAALTSHCDAPPAHLRAALAQLHERGWVVERAS
jgi:hypothetical protein